MTNFKFPLKAKDLGERQVIEKIIANLDVSPEMALSFGEDVAATSIDHGCLAVLKTDMLVGETDIPPGMTLKQAARKAIVMNISDFAAKGVTPLALLASLGLPRDITEMDVEAISKGLNDGAREYDTFIIGGDTGEASSLIICGMVFGISTRNKLLLRSGARSGDILAVTGPFGKTAAGLKILLEGFNRSNLEQTLLDSVYFPRARLSEGIALAQTGVVSASIDSSDGLATCLHELGKMSHVGFTVTKIPIAEEVVWFAEKNGLDASELAFYGGEEYELVLTVKPEGWHSAQQAIRKVGGELIAIGQASEGSNIVFKKGKVEQKIRYGWEHFKS